MSFFDKDNKDPPKSRFQVTPRIDIESQPFDLNSPTTPLSPDETSPNYGPYFSPHFFSTLDESNEKSNSHNNTATTTSVSSNSSFYNTIYKYNRLKQNGPSLDALFPFRRPSHTPYSLIGISFYNERVLVYNFLQRPTGIIAITYHVIVSIAVVYCLILTIMSTTSSKCLLSNGAMAN